MTEFLYNNIVRQLKINSFKIKLIKKNKIFIKLIKSLLLHHYRNNKEFKYLYKKNEIKKIKKIEDIKFLSVRLFKEKELFSLKKKNVFKILKSSGTSSNVTSKIFLDKKNASLQTKTLIKIYKDFFKVDRLPMIIVDKKNLDKDNIYLSANIAGANGFSNLGKDITYVLNEDLTINYQILNNFIKKYRNSKKLIFGLTNIIWDKFICQLKKANVKLDLNKSIIIHGGGWKKLQHLNINNQIFIQNIKQQLNVKNVSNYYGMVEQVGSIFFECQYNFFHSSIFSDVIIRDKFLKPLKNNNEGFIQLLSLLPVSYPGNSILTEDMGKIYGIDNCKCGRSGKYFKFTKRINQSEVRGCGDAT
jgi:phenylacetate-coenzyme A ligase PaaK-like adenylate-forming protein